MNKLKLSIILLICFTASLCFAEPRWYQATSLTGGSTSSADSINGQNLADGDKLIVITTTNSYFYTLDADSGSSEDSTSYTVISPDSNAGDKRWVLEGIIYDFAFTTLADDATPSVANENRFLTGGTTTITDLDDGITGQIITIISEHSITITDGTNIFLSGSANFEMVATDTLTLICKSDNKWYEIGRSDNT